MAWNRPESLEGLSYRFRCEDDRLEGIEAAFDYRGDITLHLTKGREVSGFLFDRSGRGTSGTVELLVPNVQQPRVIEQSEIEGVTFSGKDPAAGHSWEAWSARRAEAAARGEIAERFEES